MSNTLLRFESIKEILNLGFVSFYTLETGSSTNHEHSTLANAMIDYVQICVYIECFSHLNDDLMTMAVNFSLLLLLFWVTHHLAAPSEIINVFVW